MRFAIRSTWIVENPLEKLERDERPHPVRPTGRVLGQQEIALLLGVCTPASRTPIATALYTGLRISELLGLTWSDLDLREGTLRVRAQLSRASHGSPARRVAPKTAAAQRQIHSHRSSSNCSARTRTPPSSQHRATGCSQHATAPL